jgi:ATP-dependent Clp protease ATP-binding subunit ClpC
VADDKNEQEAAVSEGLERICAAVIHKAPRGATPNVVQWALAMVEQRSDLAAILMPGLESTDVRRRLRAALQNKSLGPEIAREEAIARASEAARAAGRNTATEEDLASVLAPLCGPLLDAAPVVPPPITVPVEPSPPSRSHTTRRRALEQYTTNLTAAARAGDLVPVVGRDREIEMVIETLCRMTKRNPVLVGPAGVGKTAIVEGVAQRLVSGDAPHLLRSTTIYALQPTSLIAGAHDPGTYIERVQQVIEQASAPDVILFVDEAHAMVGSDSLVTLLKPALARGDIACIAATTDHEYRTSIERDSALERRFQPIRVSEMGMSETLRVLQSHVTRLEKHRGVTVGRGVLRRIVSAAAERMPNRNFPDKAVDVLEQAVAHAVAHRQQRVGARQVTAVVERMTGVPGQVSERLVGLQETLTTRAILLPADVDDLVWQLRVATNGLDRWPERPNAVVLLEGEATDAAVPLAEALADSLAGSHDCVVTYDLSNMVHPADVSRLIGSGPGYVGYGDELPIHRLLQYPWSVLLLKDIDQCHPAVASAIASAVQAGSVTDGMGRTIRLCDSVVIMTAGAGEGSRRGTGIGFRAKETERAVAPASIEGVPSSILSLCTQVIKQTGDRSDHKASHRAVEAILDDLTRSYASRGLEVEWAEGVVDWIVRSCAPSPDNPSIEDDVARKIGKVLLGYVPKPGGTSHVRVTASGSGLEATPEPHVPKSQVSPKP